MANEGDTKRCAHCGTGTMTYSESHALPGQTAGVPEGGQLPAVSRFAGWLCGDPKCRWYAIVRMNP